MRHGHPRPTPDHHHRNKRPYQPSITDFFVRDDSDGSDSEDWERGSGPITRPQHHASAPRRQRQQRESYIPAVPEHLQADLLSVGMRVRKSVPEGYKTHKTVLPSIQTTLTITSPNGSASTTATITDHSVKPPRDAVPDDYQHQRELLPFCGLHKIGGFAEQPVTNVHLYSGADDQGGRALNMFPLPAEAFTQPFSSQSSTDSSVSNSSLRPNPANSSKRSWQDDDDKPAKLNSNFFFKIPVKVSEDEVPVSPLSETPPQNIHAFPQSALRPFAQPRTRRQGGRAMDFDGMVIKEGDVDMDVENAEQEGRVLVGSPGDFGEAEFLKPWAAGREVDMSGV